MLACTFVYVHILTCTFTGTHPVVALGSLPRRCLPRSLPRSQPGGTAEHERDIVAQIAPSLAMVSFASLVRILRESASRFPVGHPLRRRRDDTSA
ncbi:hypothetical protein L209DRAFT_749345 [Thermothelomyces heterothallicus CBS 203.75]